MEAEKHRKSSWQKFFSILNAYKPKTQLIKALHYIDSTKSFGRLSQNLKTGDFRELFLSENDFKTCLTVNFRKIHPDFGGLEINQRHKIQT